jgi:hypothetical protein
MRRKKYSNDDELWKAVTSKRVCALRLINRNPEDVTPRPQNIVI